jgi:hypothetical protein
MRSRDGRPVTEMFTWEQVAEADPAVVPDVAFTDAVPGERQVSSPPDETIATVGAADFQFADEVTSVVVPFA